MNKLEFNFSDDSFNKLFPFYILIDESLQIKSFGKSFAKICPFIATSNSFTDNFIITRPNLANPSFDELVLNSNQLIVIKSTTKDITMRGQFEKLDNSILFVGSPWFNSMHDVVEKKLTLHDFALHDPQIDLLHLLNNQENNSKELKELLMLVNNQKNKLKIANKENQDIALFSMQNPDPLIRIDANGNLLKRNPSAEKLSSFNYENVHYSPEDFFKFIINKIDISIDRWIFEVYSGNKIYSFICKSLKDVGYINIYGRDVTDQKKVQEELNRLSLVASANENGVVFTEPNGTIIWCNEAYLHLTGYSKEEVLGKTPIEIGKCEETTDREVLKMTIPFLKGDVFNVEHLHRSNGGANFWAKTKGQPILDAKGDVKQYFAMIEDITEKKEAEFKLVDSNNRLASLIINLQTGIILEDEHGKILLANKKFCLMLNQNQEPESLIGLNLLNSIDDHKWFFKDPNLYVKRIKEILRRKEIVTDEEVYLQDGRIYERSFIPIFRNGIYKGNLRSYVDITLKKKYEESLKIEKEKYQNIIANMNLGLLEVDKKGKILLANQSFCMMSGYSLEELQGKKATDLLLTKKSQELVKSRDALFQIGKTDSYEVKIINKNQQKRHWLVSGAPNIGFNGKTTGTIGIHLDVTEQKEQEEQLYLLSLIAEKNINSVIIYDNQGRVEWANKSFIKMTGYESNEIIGQKSGQLLQGEETNPETVAYLKDRISQGMPFNCEIVNYSKNGQKYWVSINGQALYNKTGEIIKYFAIEEDITQRKEFESQREFLVDSLAKSNKELEDYASIVSHDLKSPLRSIHSLISWIKEDNDKEFNSQTLKYLGMVENKVEKMDHLIEGILTYAKIDKADKVVENVNTQEIVQNIINIIHIPAHVKVTIDDPLPTLKADRFRIQQLFQNIISNAVNYIDKSSGIVSIGCSETSDDYLFSIRDNGPGIAKENQEKIFKIFQSIETTDKSTGLGLSIVKKIVELYNGEIWIESEMGQGTTFFIKLKK
jgi:PAS domain S-box-containing protein